MATQNVQLKPEDLGITPGADTLIKDNKWVNWNELPGDAVLSFIKNLLAHTVTDLEYDPKQHHLKGLNAFNLEICSTEIINADPYYQSELSLNSIYVNDLLYTLNTEIPYSDSLKFKAGISFKVWFSIVSDTSIRTELIVRFYLQNNERNYIEVPVIPLDVNDTGEIKVDITELIQKETSDNLANAIILAKFKSSDSKIPEATASYSINIIKLGLTCTSELIVYDKIKYTISGIPNNANGYGLKYFLVSLKQSQNISTNSGLLDSLSYFEEIKDLNNTISIDLSNKDSGIYFIYARLLNLELNATITSNWLLTNVIKITQNYSGPALINIDKVPSTFLNCDSSLLYNVDVIPGSGGSVYVKSYLANTNANIISDGNLYKTNSYENLTPADEILKIPVYSYNELPKVSQNNSRYLGIQLEINNELYTLKRFYIHKNTLQLRAYDYYPISIIENLNNINDAFNFVLGSILDFSQITSTNNQIFIKDNIDSNLVSGDGYQLDNERIVYKISPQYTNTENGLFKNPINLNALLTGDFTLDIIYKSENASDDSSNFSIGKLLFGPGFMYLDGSDRNKTDSLVSFYKEDYTHLIITYTKNYKPSTYTNTYKDFFPNYDLLNNCSYNVLKIYVNGCINREIQINEPSLFGDFLFLIHPTTSTLKIALFRTYDFALNYNLILKNTISGFMRSLTKIDYFNKNNILNEDGTISFYKALLNHNVLVHVLPYNSTPVWFYQQQVEGSSLLIHYKNPSYTLYNGRFVGKEEGQMIYKNLGSSANEYLFHNTAIQKFAFQTEESVANGTANRNLNYYVMPNDTNVQITKIVGKVNYASSMQSHKPGSCTTFNDAYMELYKSEDPTYADFKKNLKLYSGGRKAVNELPFLYFYYIVENDTIDPENIKLLDLFTVSTDGIVDDRKIKFFGFQTWGSAKGDPATSGYDQNKTPEYLLMEGADNSSLGANFKMPWAALQSKLNTTESITKNDRTTGLLIEKETIKYELTNTNPWDIDFGCDDNKTQFTDSVKESVKIFADFCDAMYLYDFLNLRGITKDKIAELTAKDAIYKYYITDGDRRTSLTDRAYRQFDLIRYDQKEQIWVHGGLTRTGTNWDILNLKTYLLNLEYSTDPVVRQLPNKDEYYIDDTNTDVSDVMSYVIPCFRELFKIAIEHYCDIEDLAFHQAFIKILAGTDNRAKNTYYLIIGKIYEEDPETKLYVKTDIGDYKIRMLVDDLDTIFATNNNGLQVIPSHIIEPVFNSIYDEDWNDKNNALFYQFDLLYEDKIAKYTQFIINYLIEGLKSNISDKTTKLYNNYFSIQDNFPEIAYNHHSEIYYELANLVYYNGVKRDADADTQSRLIGFFNNSVIYPLSLAHGRCLESEYLFLTDRLIMLGSLYTAPDAFKLCNTSLSLSDSSGGEGDYYEVKAEVTSNKYVAPVKGTSDSSFNTYSNVVYYKLKDILDTRNESNGYEPNGVESVLQQLYPDDDTSIKAICNLMTPNSPETTMIVNGTGNKVSWIMPTDSFKTIKFSKGLNNIHSFLSFERTSLLEIDGEQTGYSCSDNGLISISNYLELVEILKMTNVLFTGTSVVLDFRGCNKLKEIDLTGCTGIQGIIIPSNKYLEKLTLPTNLTTLSLGHCLQLNYTNLTISNSNLNSVSIDGRNKFIADFIEDHIQGFNGQLTITNPETLELSYKAISILADLENLTFIGVKNINVPEMHFLVKFKLHRHPSFAGISINCDETIEFTKVEFYPNPYTISHGTSNSYLQCLDFVTDSGQSANNIDIDKLTFSINTVSEGVTFNPNTLEITVESTVNDDTEITLTIKYDGEIWATPILKVGFNIPKLGYFAYSDGSFGPKYNSSKAIGYVYKCLETSQKGTYEVSIMSLKPIEASLLGYSEPREYITGNESDLYNLITKYDDRLNSEKQIIDNFPTGSGNPLTSCRHIISTTSDDTIMYKVDATSAQLYGSTVEEYESNIMIDHVKSALCNYVNLRYYATNILESSIIQDHTEILNNLTFESKKKIQSILLLMNSTYRYVFKTSEDTLSIDINAMPILFPAYLRTYAYVPSACDQLSKHKVVLKYLNQPWKIPSTHTVAYLVRDIMKSLNVNNTDANNWTSVTGFNTKSEANNIFSNIATNNEKTDVGEWIAFLGTNPKMTCEFGYSDAVYVNHSYHLYTTSTAVNRDFLIDTHHRQNYYSSNPVGLRSETYDYIYPCITISLSKKDYVNN